jgi:asparaginyl-tRNA synthetase
MSEKSNVIATSIQHLDRQVGKEVLIRGWVYNTRSSGKILFLLLRDGTGIVQCPVIQGEVADKIFADAEKLTQESSLEIQGVVREDKRAPGGYEVTVKDLKVFQVAGPYPITPKEHGTAFLMEHRHLWLRSKRQTAILRVRSEIIQAMRDFMAEREFTCLDAPIFTPNACEGTTTLFQTDYFGEKAYLTQSGQLYNEATAAALGKVYCFGPCFRAEKSKTRRHVTEMWMMEPEMAYATLDDMMALSEDLTVYVVERVLSRRMRELKDLERDVSLLEKVKKPFPRISYDEACEILRKNGVDFQWGGDFGGGDETVLANQFEAPFFVHRFPAAVKAFYMKRDPARPEVVLGADMLAPEGYGEIVGGGQREDDLAILEQRIAEEKLPREAFQWYLDLRRYGSVPHAGFGIGVERTVCWICRLDHIRESIPFPRLLEKMYP